ncbi:MAG: NusG domain II-containing protein [Eubacteriales bacterium]|nr:NusG domain II-containing protein [Eubacteriales bacterium]
MFLALSAWLCLRFFQREGKMVQISVEGTVTECYPLGEDRTVEIAGAGGKNILSIAGGCASMTGADCPDKICVSHREVRSVGETIVCLPHKVVVEIVGEEDADSGRAYDVMAQ